MAIVIYDQPEAYQLAYNDNVYVFRASISTDTKRFKVSVVPNGSLTPIATIRVYPTPATNGPTDRAFVDVSRILQSKLGHDVSIPEAGHLGFIPNTESHYEYALIIQEEDLERVVVLHQCFILFNTPEKWKYWNKIANRINN